MARVFGRRRDASGGERGQALVEFALVTLTFFLLAFGIVDFGRAIHEYTLLASSAREAARVAIIQTNTDDAVIERAVASSGRLIAPEDVAIGGVRTCVALPCGTVTVAVSRAYTPATPLIAAIVGDALILRASSTMVVER